MDVQYLMQEGEERSQIVIIRSADRDKTAWPSANEYVATLEEPIRNVIGVDLLRAHVPKTAPDAIRDGADTIGVTVASVVNGVTVYKPRELVILPHGDYAEADGEADLTAKLTTALAPYGIQVSTASPALPWGYEAGHLKFRRDLGPFLLDFRQVPNSASEPLGFGVVPPGDASSLYTQPFHPLTYNSVVTTLANAEIVDAFQTANVAPSSVIDAHGWSSTILTENGLSYMSSVVAEVKFAVPLEALRPFKATRTLRPISATAWVLPNSQAEIDVEFRVLEYAFTNTVDGVPIKVYHDEPVVEGVAKVLSGNNEAFVEFDSDSVLVAGLEYALEITCEFDDDYIASVPGCGPYASLKMQQDSSTTTVTPSGDIVTAALNTVLPSQRVRVQAHELTTPARACFSLPKKVVVFVRSPDLERQLESPGPLGDFVPGTVLGVTTDVGYGRGTFTHPLGFLEKFKIMLMRDDGSRYDTAGTDHVLVLVVRNLVISTKSKNVLENAARIQPGYTPDNRNFLEGIF